MKNENKKSEITEVEEQGMVEIEEQNEQSNSDWVLKLSEPIVYNGEEIKELHFNFNKLTGLDAIEIEDELQRTGKITMYSQVTNVHFITRAAARACTKPVGIDIFGVIPMPDFEHLRNKVQLFLINIPS